MLTNCRQRRFSVAATTAVLLFSAVVVGSALCLRESGTVAAPDGPGPLATGHDRKESVESSPERIEVSTRVHAIAVAVAEELPAATREEQKGPGLTLLAEVTSTDGQPVAGASLFAFGRMDRRALTDDAGRCELWLDLAPKRKAYAVKIEKSGLLPRSVILQGEIEGHDTWPLKIELEAVGAAAPVSGYLYSTDGPVANETILLYAAATHMSYRATSNDEGYFDLGDVALGSYQARVRPRGGYEDYVDSSLDVAAPGLDLDLELRRIEPTGSLRGRMITPEGAVVPGFTLYLRSRKSLGNVIAVKGDAEGWCALEGLAAGEVLLESRGFPRHVVRGLRAGPSDADEIEVVVDAGDRALEGVVENESGEPVAGARVELLWSRTDGEVEYSSARQSTTDTDGRFHFEGFAPVEHEIRIQHTGHTTALQTVTAGQEQAAIRLARAG